MRIKKILNNNAVITRDASNKEIIVMGKGIAYGCKNGALIDQSKVYKTFSLDSETMHNRMIDLIEQIPIEYFNLTEEVVKIAKDRLDVPLNDGIYISLTDHIYSSIQRYHEGIPLKNKLQWEIKQYYKKEYDIGLEAVDLIKEETGISMLEDEAGFIAMHIVSSDSERLGLEAIRGVEMSCYDFDEYKKVHMLGLWLDRVDHIEKLCSKTLEARDRYHKEMIKDLEQKGYYIIYEDAKKFSKYNIVFKMHVYLALKEKYPNDMNPEKYKELFASKTSKETDLKMNYIDVKDGIEAIKKDGGIAVLAHPCVYQNYEQIGKYVDLGLQGVEVDHSRMKDIDYKLTEDYAAKYKLQKSGGSDFHDPELLKSGINGLSKEQFEELKAFALSSKI